MYPFHIITIRLKNEKNTQTSSYIFIGRPTGIDSSMDNAVHLSSRANSITPKKKVFLVISVVVKHRPHQYLVLSVCCTCIMKNQAPVAAS